MRFAVLTCAVAGMLAFVAYAPAHADPKYWESGKNTWKDAKKGDWAEYGMDLGNGVRYEVTSTADGKVTYRHVMKDKEGKALSDREVSREWQKCPLFGKLPHKIAVQWSEADYKIGEQVLKCDVATWVAGTSQMGVWYCDKVPCGGVVKQVLDGKDTVWLKAFKTKELGEAKADDKPVEPAAKSKLPRFYQAEGNYYIHKITRAETVTYIKRSVIGVNPDSTTTSAVACDAEGVPASGARVGEAAVTEKEWLDTYAKPEREGETVKTAAGEFKCAVYKSKSGARDIEEWVFDGLPVKRVITEGDKITTLEVVKYEMKE